MNESTRPGTQKTLSQPARAVTIDTMALRIDDGATADAGPNAIMYAWFQLFKTAQIHHIENQALVRPVQSMVNLSTAMVGREGRISLQAKDNALFVNGQKLKLSTEEYEIATGIFAFLEERGMGGFVIEGALTTDSVRQLLQIMVYSNERKFEKIAAALHTAELPLRINKPLRVGRKSDSEVVLERRGYTFLTYSKLVVLYRALIAEEKRNSSKRQFLSKKIARTVQALVDICLEDDHTFIGVAAVKNGEAYAPHHAANTTVLSIVLGEKLGLGKVELADLGLAAVFHDVGLASCGGPALEKGGPLDASERAALEQHPIASVEYLLEEKKYTRSALERIVVAFEHHRHFAGGGYPAVNRRPDLLSRIVSIAATYDALTTARPWRPAHLPDEALGNMLRQSGKVFDPVLMKIFVNTVGLYPAGTLVRLDSNELGVVVYGGGEGDRVSRPVVVLIGSDGQPGQTIDLTERAGDGYRRTIVSSEDPAKYGIQTSGLVAGSAGMAP